MSYYQEDWSVQYPNRYHYRNHCQSHFLNQIHCQSLNRSEPLSCKEKEE